MDKSELTAWALKHGWRMMGGHPSLTKPSSPKEAIVRMVLLATVVNVEAKKPAGKWEKIAGAAYGQVQADPESGEPLGLGFEKIPSFRMLMQENRDRQVFAGFGR
jgi:hypothetical protein